ncbi:hypothetical protein PLICRDRAFT_150218 [Plicaturopsis crispa FD-325 SS-3]|nr:hypothetical protein PLICRDRAFT_150218 [Plicaturopsis crispa FD-325 SS-3]
MNNLLRTLTESRSSLADSDLKLLLTTVKDGRRQAHDSKTSDAFYDSLEGLLLDLRTITMDNHDAEAFLKPVSKTDYVDYPSVVSNPMDLQTMLKKVKSKQYKSKKEFKDDLDLIWHNCYAYNATENHPLRRCADRLAAKAEKLLKNITDRKERADPAIPSDLSHGPRRLNGARINGHGPARSTPSVSRSASSTHQLSKIFGRDVPFAETPAIVRTASGMTTFAQLDREIDEQAGPSKQSYGYDGTPTLSDRLTSFAVPTQYDSDENDSSFDDSTKSSQEEVGDKRKYGGLASRPRKRPRLHSHPANRDRDVTELWWDAVQSDALIGNGLPVLVHSSSQRTPASHPRSPRKKKRRKGATSPANSMLGLMNNNIKTMRRVRQTHAKFAVLNAHSEEGGAAEESLEAPGEIIAETVDENPWRPRGSGIELGEENASDCLHWMGGKVLEHAGFQGTSKVALDVLTSVTSEYFLNVGRTIRYLCDKYSNQMSAEEIILHTLFESGTTKIQDLERYIKDDVIRYGSRLGDLEKKLVGAYREVTAVEVLDDDDLFGNEDEEEDGAFVMGEFADAFGEDFLGLRELGIAAELGMSDLSIPKRLLKGKRKGANEVATAAAIPTEPPPPYPPPPPFIPLTSDKIGKQIGLLQPYYHARLPPQPTSVSVAVPLSVPPSMAPPLPPPISVPQDAPITLPDDVPTPVHAKLGPLGQVLKGAAAGASKKKVKKEGGVFGMPDTIDSGSAVGDTPKKKKASGVGTGNGGKKKAKAVADGAIDSPSLPPGPMIAANI